MISSISYRAIWNDSKVGNVRWVHVKEVLENEVPAGDLYLHLIHYFFKIYNLLIINALYCKKVHKPLRSDRYLPIQTYVFTVKCNPQFYRSNFNK